MMDKTTFSVRGGPEMPLTKDNLHRELSRLLNKGRDPAAPELPAVAEHADNVAGAELRSFIERFEQLEAEHRDISDQMKEVMAEAKGRGYDTKVLRKVIALRKRDPADVAEEQAVLEMYESALGMA